MFLIARVLAFVPAVGPLTGCELACRQEVGDFVAASVKECGGTLHDFSLVQVGAKRLSGLALVLVDGEEYKSPLIIKQELGTPS